jgi:hypothetical protein
MRPALARGDACVTGFCQKTIFLQNAPATIAASRTYHPSTTLVAGQSEFEVVH